MTGMGGGRKEEEEEQLIMSIKINHITVHQPDLSQQMSR
jgi:hypothetical protein